jgi:hypothetical protein
MDAKRLRELFREACHGAGAEPRWKARAEIEKVADQRGIRIGALLEEAGLDVTAYFASRPISPSF